MKRSIIRDKSYQFAIRIINLYKYLSKDKQEFILSKQILRSGTAIGALVEESLGGESNADFIHKLSIAYKEARETLYWIRLLRDTEYLTIKEAESIQVDLDEILKILPSIIKTTKSKIIKNNINH